MGRSRGNNGDEKLAKRANAQKVHIKKEVRKTENAMGELRYERSEVSGRGNGEQQQNIGVGNC